MMLLLFNMLSIIAFLPMAATVHSDFRARENKIYFFPFQLCFPCIAIMAQWLVTFAMMTLSYSQISGHLKIFQFINIFIKVEIFSNIFLKILNLPVFKHSFNSHFEQIQQSSHNVLTIIFHSLNNSANYLLWKTCQLLLSVLYVYNSIFMHMIIFKELYWTVQSI